MNDSNDSNYSGYSQFSEPTYTSGYYGPETKPREKYWLHILLFVLTFFATTLAGVQWSGHDPFDLANFGYGLIYAGAILFVLGSHEFGHYFAARYHGVSATLPFFIPFPPIPFFLNFGTLGAVIRTRSTPPTRKAMFDIGVAGPFAGFVACIILLIYGFTHLPGPEFILAIHNDYNFALNMTPPSPGAIQLEFGQTLLFKGLRDLLTNPSMQFVPPMSEIYHYPFLCVGWFGLFVTAMNLVPIGQFDGGHVLYTMLGKRHAVVARGTFLVLLTLGFPSVIDMAVRGIFQNLLHITQIPEIPLLRYSWSGWFLWAVISYTIVKLDHPHIEDETPLGTGRFILGLVAILVFILSFSINPFIITE